MTATEISRTIAAGEFPGLDPYELPESTVRYHAAKARRDLDPVPEGVDLDAITDALERKSAARVREEIGKLHARSTLKPGDLKQLRELHRTLAAISSNRGSRTERGKDGANGRTAKQGKPPALLAALGAAIDQSVPSDSEREPNGAAPQ